MLGKLPNARSFSTEEKKVHTKLHKELLLNYSRNKGSASKTIHEIRNVDSRSDAISLQKIRLSVRRCRKVESAEFDTLPGSSTNQVEQAAALPYLCRGQ